MPQYPDGLVDSLIALNELLAWEEGLTTTLDRVAAIACRAVPGCESAGVTLERPDGPRTMAHSGDAALVLDGAQYEEGAGPCLQSFLENEVVLVREIADGPLDWRHFAQAAHEIGIRSSLSVPLVVGGLPIGALNLYSSAPGGLADHVELATLFGQQAAVAIANAEIYWRAFALTENLRQALENRDLLGQAKGVLMARQDLAADAAFELLRRSAQRSGEALADVAQHVVRTGSLPGGDADR